MTALNKLIFSIFGAALAALTFSAGSALACYGDYDCNRGYDDGGGYSQSPVYLGTAHITEGNFWAGAEASGYGDHVSSYTETVGDMFLEATGETELTDNGCPGGCGDEKTVFNHKFSTVAGAFASQVSTSESGSAGSYVHGTAGANIGLGSKSVFGL